MNFSAIQLQWLWFIRLRDCCGWQESACETAAMLGLRVFFCMVIVLCELLSQTRAPIETGKTCGNVLVLRLYNVFLIGSTVLKVTIRLGQGSSLFQGRVLHLIMSWICPRFGIF